MKLFLIVSLILTLAGYPGVSPCLAQADGEDITIGSYKTLYSQTLDEERLLFVHLPREYEETELDYPVLYLLYVDIYNYFTDAVMITEKLGTTGEIPPLIIVGVQNSNRYRDLLPAKKSSGDEGGGAGEFLTFIEEELIPHVDSSYRTKPFRILAGPQAAAVFSLYALLTRPGLFNAVISENPFMNPDNAAYLYPLAEKFFNNRKSLKTYLRIKCEKDERPQDLEYMNKLKALIETSPPDGFRFTYDLREPSGYFIAPMPFGAALRELFAGHKLPDNFQTESVQDIIDYYRNLSGEYGFSVDPPSLMLTFEGSKLNRRGKKKEAIELFEYQLGLNGRSLNALFQLGETYLSTGNLERAKQYYEAFLSIEDNDAAFIQRRLDSVNRMLTGSAAWRIEQAVNRGGFAAGLELYQAIQADTDSNLYFDEGEFNALGYRLMGNGRMKDAVEIFKLNVEMHPKSANTHDSLAEAYMKSGDTRRAIEHYKKSLSLNPGNDNAREQLKKLEGK